MNILVAISRVPDTTTKITLNNEKINEDGVQWVINPYDEWYALVKAVELKEADSSVNITVVNVGDSASEAILRKALSYGADEAIRINTTAKDSFEVATQLAQLVREKNYDLILTGKESIDYNQGAVGGILAGLLNIPYLALANKLAYTNNTLEITREIEGGEEKNSVQLPAVIGCTKGMATQRIPNMRGIMAARTKPLYTVEATDTQYLSEVVGYELPTEKGTVQLFDADNVAPFVQMLKDKKFI